MSPRKILPLFLLSLLCVLPAWSATPGDSAPPRGNFAELHSCELYAGSCIVSAEANVTGNYVLRVWQFDGGGFAGVPLRGLTAALLEKSDDNLAVTDNRASGAVAYVPPGLSLAQKSALLAWVQQATAVKLDDAHVKVVPLQMAFNPEKIQFSAGKAVTFAGGMPPACGLSSCGEALWYQPRTDASSFVVDQLGQSRIVEPLLSVRWMDHGRRTLFAGRFGDPEISVPPICGPLKTASL